MKGVLLIEGHLTTNITYLIISLWPLGKGYFTLGKAFAECNTRQRTLGKDFIGKGFFSECFFRTLGKSTQQRKTLGKLRIEKKLKKTAKHFFKF
jgi:hypothetical protein